MRSEFLLKIFFISLIILLSSFSLKAQVPCPDNAEDWTSRSYGYNAYGISASVDGAWRTADAGYFEVKVDWSTLTRNDNGMIATDALKNLLLMQILNTLPGPSNTPLTCDLYYVSPCSSEVKTAIRTRDDGQPLCCDDQMGFSNKFHKWFPPGGYDSISVVYATKIVECGHKCCKKTIEFERYVMDPPREPYCPIIINSITTSTYSECEPTIDLHDCLDPNAPLHECTGSCDW